MTTDTTRPTRATRPPIWSTILRIVVAIGLTAAGLVALLVLPGDLEAGTIPTLLLRIAGGFALSIVVVAIVVVLTRLVDRRLLAEIGLTGPADAWRAFLSGILAWLTPATAAFGVLALLGAPLAITASADRFWTVLLLVLLAVLLSEAIPEELVFRGYVTRVLGERLRGWGVIVVQAVLFTATAVILRGGAVDPIDLSLFAAMGVGLGYLRMVTGSVWTTVGFHLAFQTVSQLIFSHEVVSFPGTQLQAMVALGMVPFAVGLTLVAILAPIRPALFARQRS